LVEAQHAAIDCLLGHIFKVPEIPKEKTIQIIFQNTKYALEKLVKKHIVNHEIL
jgi:hypothetical protein